MRTSLRLLLALQAGIGAAVLWACVGDDAPASPGSDGGTDTGIGSDTGTTQEAGGDASGDAGAPGEPLWLVPIQGDNVSIAFGTVDDQGAMYVSGDFQGSLKFGADTVTSEGTSDTFLAKVDASGKPQWVKRFGSTGGLASSGDVAFGGGFVYQMMYFRGSVTLGSNVVTAVADGTNFDFTIAKFDRSGNYLSHVFASGPGQQTTGALLPRSDGVLFTADNSGTINAFLGGTWTATSSRDQILGRAFGNGNDLVQQYANAGGWAIAGPAVGPFAIWGGLRQTTTVGGRVLAVPDGGVAYYLNTMAANLSSQNAYEVTRTTGGAINLLPHLDAANAPFLFGSFNGTLGFPGGSSAVGSSDAAHPTGLVAKWGAGVIDWKKTFDNAGVASLDHDRANRVLACGAMTADSDFGAGPVSDKGKRDAFVAVYSATGSFVHQRSFGDANDQACSVVRADPNDDVLIAGSFQGAIALGGLSATAAGSNNGYIAKLRAP